MRPHSLKTHRYYPTGYSQEDYSHQVLCATLGESDREEYIIDLSGAQYNQFRTVVPWEEYFTNNCLGLEKREKLGNEMKAFASKEAVTAADPDANNEFIAVLESSARMRVRFKAAIEDWESSQAQTVRRLLQGSKPRYEEGKQLLLRMVHDVLKECVDERTSLDLDALLAGLQAGDGN